MVALVRLTGSGGGSSGTSPGISKHFVVNTAAERDALIGLRSGDEVTVIDNGAGAREDWIIVVPGDGTWPGVVSKVEQRARSNFTRMPEQSADFSAIPGGLYPIDVRAGTVIVTPPALSAIDTAFVVMDSRNACSDSNRIEVATEIDLLWSKPDRLSLREPGVHITLQNCGVVLGWCLTP